MWLLIENLKIGLVCTITSKKQVAHELLENIWEVDITLTIRLEENYREVVVIFKMLGL